MKNWRPSHEPLINRPSGLQSWVYPLPWGLLSPNTRGQTYTSHSWVCSDGPGQRALTKVGSGNAYLQLSWTQRLSPRWAAHQPPRALSLILPFAQRPCVPGENQPSGGQNTSRAAGPYPTGTNPVDVHLC